MKRFKNVLVVYDDAIGGDDALGQAVALARENTAHLTITTILRDRQLCPRTIDEANKRLQRLALGIRHAGVSEVRTTVLTGIPFLEIVRQVIDEQHDLVIAGMEPGSVFREVLFGRTAIHLMRKCSCPVWVVKPGQTAPYARILAAVDPQSATSNDHFSIKIMDLATSLISRDAFLHIVHAWEVEGSDLDSIKCETVDQRCREILEHHHGKHRLALKELLAGYPMSAIKHCVHLTREGPERAINRIAEQEKIDLIVMGTVARRGVPGFFIGNAAEKILSSVKSGVITVKPHEFRTPISPLEQVFARNTARDKSHHVA